jgi:hypothetical protein
VSELAGTVTPVMGPELDYAFLAEYAAVSPHGTLTAVGASFTRVAYPSFPAQQLMAVAGRNGGSGNRTSRSRCSTRM